MERPSISTSPAGRFKQPIDQLQGGGLSRAAAAEQDQRLAARDREAHAAQQLLAAGETVAGVAKFDDGVGPAAGRLWRAHGEESVLEESADVVQHACQHSLCEPAGERVLLAGMVGNEQARQIAVDRVTRAVGEGELGGRSGCAANP